MKKLLCLLPVLLLGQGDPISHELRVRYSRASHELFLAESAVNKARAEYASVKREVEALCLGRGGVRMDQDGAPACAK